MPPRDRPRIRHEELKMDAPESRYYANVVRLRGGAYDVTLDFGYRAGDEPKPEPLARVVMSYEHVAAVARLLQNLLDQYSETVGPIPDPEGLASEKASETASEASK